MPVEISIKGLCKKAPGGLDVFKDFHLDIPAGQITALFGPNGCGKSTLLSILAGSITKDGGVCDLGDVGPFDVSYIFQNYRDSLLPWRTNAQNVAFPLKIQRQSREFIQERMDEVQELFQFSFEAHKYPYEMSGGQQQLLAFMRSLVTHPSVLLVDEPFSALDYENNLALRHGLQKYYLKYRPTIVLVTHNIEEAVHLGSRIVVLSSKPTRVLEVVEHASAYPRTTDVLQTDLFHQTKNRVLSAFQRTVSL